VLDPEPTDDDIDESNHEDGDSCCVVENVAGFLMFFIVQVQTSKNEEKDSNENIDLDGAKEEKLALIVVR